jgi:DNA processing protein
MMDLYALDEKRYWLAFHLVQHIGTVRIQQLVNHFGSLSTAWHASADDLQAAGLSDQPLQNLLKARNKLDLDEEWRKIERAGAEIITALDEDYPENLRSITDAPPVLYVKGTLLPTDVRALAVVGTRRATRYGIDVAHRLSHWLASHGTTIISGLAQGVDSAAHQGALSAGGRTIAVMGTGIDSIYPRVNASLAEEIIENGAIITEFPIGTPPSGVNFPRRNRIISGLALGVLVAEAPENSGALITAEVALEQGREVFAVPSSIFNSMGTGCNRLIQDGARLVIRASEILDELDMAYNKHEVRVNTRQVAPENEKERKILAYLESEASHIDDIIRETGLSSADVTSTLTILELKGLAQMVGHMQYCRSR